MSLIQQFNQFIIENELFDKEERLLVAVSGGIDSTVLLNLMVKNGYQVAIAHCNFCLRGEESNGDERLVRQLQKKYGINGYYISFDTEKEATEKGESIQMAARRLRYTWFSELCNNEGFRYIAVAHNSDDVSETFFLNITRGTGIKGLTGIKPKTGRIVRPLLFATRAQIAEYSESNQLRFREDSSNAKDKYARNRIRHNVIPEFKKINPSFSKTMNENIQRLRMVEEFINYEVNNFKKNCITHTGEEQHISISTIRNSPNARLLLYEVLNEFGFNGAQIDGILSSINDNEPGKVFESEHYDILKDREHLILYPKRPESDETFYLPSPSFSIETPIVLQMRNFTREEQFVFSKTNDTVDIDYDKLKFPLTLRKWRVGDEFFPIGLKGRKKLSDFFIDQKYSLLEKKRQWLICSGNDIVWVVGKRIDDRFKIVSETKNILEITVKPIEPA